MPRARRPPPAELAAAGSARNPRRSGASSRARPARESVAPAPVVRAPSVPRPSGGDGAGASSRAWPPLRGELLLHLLGREPEHLRRRADVALGAERGVGHREHAVALADVDLDLGVHARPEQALLVLDPDQHREHGDVLLGLRLRLDLEHRALERPVGVGVHRDRGGLAGLDLADVGLVHQRADLDQVEVGHLEQRGAAAHVRGGRGDHRAALDVLLDDRCR